MICHLSHGSGLIGSTKSLLHTIQGISNPTRCNGSKSRQSCLGDLQEPVFARLESRAVQMFIQALPESVVNQATATTTLLANSVSRAWWSTHPYCPEDADPNEPARSPSIVSKCSTTSDLIQGPEDFPEPGHRSMPCDTAGPESAYSRPSKASRSAASSPEETLEGALRRLRSMASGAAQPFL